MTTTLRLLCGCLGVCSLLWPLVLATCPWEESGLKKWSAADTWGSVGVPQEDSEVIIPNNTRVLLDVQPATLATLTIEATGALVWGNEEGLVLSAHYIWVKGEFHMGSEACRLPVKAKIRLLGNSVDKYSTREHEFGRKFLGVAPGGVLELHGQHKTSWTQLAQTVRPVRQVPCAKVYDHFDFKQNRAKVDKQLGLNIIVWNEDGSLLDLYFFKDETYHLVPTFFTSVPDGKVVGMFTFGEAGVGTKDQVMVDFIEGLGGSQISKAADNTDLYALLVRKGFPDTAQESIEKDVGVNMNIPETEVKTKVQFLSLHDQNREIVFQVAKDHWSYKREDMFRVLHEDAAFPILTLANPVEGWNPGDEVLLTSTDFDWLQYEVRTIMKCERCSRRQVRLNESLYNTHFGNFTYDVDERGEVAMMSRSIVIEGVLEAECTERTDRERDSQICHKFHRDTFGGHLMAVRKFKAVHIEGVKLFRMGQQMHRGAYPLHFHMCDDVPGAYLRHNTVEDSFSRCVAVHGTNHLEISDNVCWKHLGHGIFLEDSVEQNNKVKGNLVGGTMHGNLLLSDKSREFCPGEEQYCDALSSYWLTHPNNDIIGNVAAGGNGVGFMYMFADRPLGPSLQRQRELNRWHNPKGYPIHFTHNVAHSNYQSGVHMDEKISTGTGMENKGNITENAVLRCENEYFPHVNGKPVWVDMARGTFYKNGQKNMWIKGGNVRIAYCSLADSKEGLTGGTTLFDTGTQAYKSIFIGETENKGEARKRNFAGGEREMTRSYFAEPTDSLTAISIYQGPILINSCYFDQYLTKDWCVDPDKDLKNCPADKLVTRFSGAISFKRSSTYPSMTSSYTTNNSFSFCDNDDRRHWVWQGADGVNDWEWKDGNKMVYLRDKDGMLTGTVNASIVTNFPLHAGPECQLRNDWGNLLVCPYRYVKLEIAGEGGNLDTQGRVDTPMLIRRDEAKYSEEFSITGQIRNEYLLRVGRSFMIDFNKNTKGAGFPRDIKLWGYGVEKGDEVRVGMCQPKGIDHYEVMMEYPVPLKNNATWVTSLKELDEDTTGAAFFHDKLNGILFFKLMSFHTDNNDTQRCPDGKCWRVVLRPQGSGISWTLRSCRNVVVKPFFGAESSTPKTPTTPQCPSLGSPEGLGAVEWNKVRFIEHNEYSVPCLTPDNPFEKSRHLGCFKERMKKEIQKLKTEEMLTYAKTMNPAYCVNRCYFRRLKYAALARSNRCTCSNELWTTADFTTTAQNCTMPCSGDSSNTCGGDDEMDVWATGH